MLDILHNYEKRGETIQNMLTEKRSFGYQGAAARANDIEVRNKITNLEEINGNLKKKIKSLEYDLKQGKQASKRKEWGKKTEETSKLESKIKEMKLKCAMAQTMVKNYEKENAKLKHTLNLMIQKSQKNERRDAKLFEKVFGKQPRNSD